MRQKIEDRRWTRAVQGLRMLMIVIILTQLILLGQLFGTQGLQAALKVIDAGLIIVTIGICGVSFVAIGRHAPRVRLLLWTLAGVSCTSFVLWILFGGTGFGYLGVLMTGSIAFASTRPPLREHFESAPIPDPV